MATVRRNMSQIRAFGSQDVDALKLRGTTEEDVRRHMVEDGEDPSALSDRYELAVPVRDLRERLGLTQDQFAKALRLSVSTLRNWEQRRVVPDPAARSLLRIVSRRQHSRLSKIEGRTQDHPSP